MPPSIPTQRQAGILLHPTSLPNNASLGTLDESAYRFVDFLDECGFGIWQVLPLHPTDEDLSPYSSPSAFAGNGALISRKELVKMGCLESGEENLKHSDALQIAFERFYNQPNHILRKSYDAFVQDQVTWLEDFALYIVIKSEYDQQPWTEWPESLKRYDTEALQAYAENHSTEIQAVYFEQFIFFEQWRRVRAYANSKSIAIFGDMPIFVAHDSADVWANQSLFQLNSNGEPNYVAGVPPDYFSADGQRWGNPLYDWSAMENTNFQWWIERFSHGLQLVDFIRVDHFRGFEACWRISAEEETAKNGEWHPVPGEALFKQLFKQLNNLPLIAEDLGIITPEVDQLRDQFGIPGMKVLQFAFSDSNTNPYLPHNHEVNSIVFTGTHDNNTTLGWFNELEDKDRERVNQYLSWPNETMPWPIIKLALSSVATWAMIPFQDILALGQDHRMNIPGTTEGNWQFQFQWDQIDCDRTEYIKFLLELYNRHK